MMLTVKLQLKNYKVTPMAHLTHEDLVLPKTWDELTALSFSLGAYEGATRRKRDQTVYDAFTKSMPRKQILRQIKDQIPENGVALLENDFPYTRILTYLPRVKHLLLWSTKGALSHEQVALIVQKKFPDKKWTHFITTDQNKSVPEIWHAHVFVNMI